MFTKMKNIDIAFRYTRMFNLLFLVGCMVLCCYVQFLASKSLSENRGKVYVLINGKLIEALAQERNIPVELRDHIKDFHTYFFTLSPDEAAIQAQVGKALYLADVSARRVYQNMKEAGYYSNLISSNISQKIEIDSIAIDMDTKPIQFRLWGIQEITRPTSTVTRSIVTEGLVRINLVQTDNNNHGFLIEKWQIIENRDLKIVNR